MRVQITETKVYTFAELSDAAKEKAIERYSRATGEDWNPEFTIDEFCEVARILGFDIDTKQEKPCVYYSGFWSQGDGACFEAHYSYAKQSRAKIREYAPKDTALHSIADDLAKVQKTAFYQLSAKSKHRGNYCHSGCMSVEIEDSRDSYRDIGENAEYVVDNAFRDLANWLYRQLESEYEYQTSREAAIEGIEANDYEFTESGKII